MTAILIKQDKKTAIIWWWSPVFFSKQNFYNKFVCNWQNRWKFWFCKSHADSDLEDFRIPAVTLLFFILFNQYCSHLSRWVLDESK